MKKTCIIYSAMLLTMLLLAGCGQNDNASSQTEEFENNAAVEESAQSQNENQTETNIDAEINSETEKETENATEENTEAGSGEEAVSNEETYTLTFEAETIDGKPLTSDCFAQSKLTMINVWATYCNPCLSEMPDLGEIAASYDTEEFQLIGIISDVSVESGEEDIENAKELITQTKADYPHLLLNESLYSNLVGAVDSVPTTFFVNRKGEILGYIIGANSKETWEEVINELLAERE